jgi:hypothetical protein
MRTLLSRAIEPFSAYDSVIHTKVLLYCKTLQLPTLLPPWVTFSDAEQESIKFVLYIKLIY